VTKRGVGAQAAVRTRRLPMFQSVTQRAIGEKYRKEARTVNRIAHERRYERPEGGIIAHISSNRVQLVFYAAAIRQLRLSMPT